MGTHAQQRHCYPLDAGPGARAYCGAPRDVPPATTMDEIREYGVCTRCHSLAMRATRERERAQTLAYALSVLNQSKGRLSLVSVSAARAMEDCAATLRDPRVGQKVEDFGMVVYHALEWAAAAQELSDWAAGKLGSSYDLDRDRLARAATALNDAVDRLHVADAVDATAAGLCPASERTDNAHSWGFDGDDPYVLCHYCGEVRDALTDRVVRPGEQRVTP